MARKHRPRVQRPPADQVLEVGLGQQLLECGQRRLVVLAQPRAQPTIEAQQVAVARIGQQLDRRGVGHGGERGRLLLEQRFTMLFEQPHIGLLDRGALGCAAYTQATGVVARRALIQVVQLRRRSAQRSHGGALSLGAEPVAAALLLEQLPGAQFLDDRLGWRFEQRAERRPVEVLQHGGGQDRRAQIGRQRIKFRCCTMLCHTILLRIAYCVLGLPAM